MVYGHEDAHNNERDTMTEHKLDRSGPPARPVTDEAELFPPSRGTSNNGGWAEYADGQWWEINTITHPLFDNVTTQDKFSTARSFAHRRGLRFESRSGPVVRGAAPVLYQVRFTRKDAKA